MYSFQRWPPLNCLRGFEAAARLSSFSRAAKELHMTQSAISHQIKTLEAYLEQPLFVRVKRKVILTDAGSALLDTTRQCLDQFGRGLQRLEHFKKPNQLIVHCGTAFAANWLVPRLGDFRRQAAAVDVWLYTTDMEPDLDLTEVHLAILHGSGRWRDLTAERLLPDTLIPVCAADHPLARNKNPAPESLLEHTLLHAEHEENWGSWFAQAGFPGINPTSGPNFSNPSLMLQSAEQGQGIALASLVLAAGALDSGRLVAALPQTLPSRFGYYLAQREDGLKSQNVAPFIAWLTAQAEAFRRGSYRRLQGKQTRD